MEVSLSSSGVFLVIGSPWVVVGDLSVVDTPPGERWGGSSQPLILHGSMCHALRLTVCAHVIS